MGDLFFRLGEAIGSLEGQVRGKGGAERLHTSEDLAAGAVLEDDRTTAQNAALAAGATWLASRLLRPKPIRWPRVIFAGVTGALLSDLVGRLQKDAPADRLPYAADPAELLGRLSAGVAVAAGYASIIYPRLPGSPLLRGLAFGALEIAAAPRGGLIRLASEAPGVRFPLQALALPVDEDASPAAHLAFGLALGLLYRDGGRRSEEEEDEGDEEEDLLDHYDEVD